MCFVVVSVETAAAAPQASSEQYTEPVEQRIKEKPRKASALTVPGKKPKQKSVKSPKRRRKVSTTKDGGKEERKGDEGELDDEMEEEEEEVVEEEEEEVVRKEDRKETKLPKEKETKGFGFKRRDLVVGECREEKAPYVTVREAKMVTLADKVSSGKRLSLHTSLVAPSGRSLSRFP